MELRLRKQALTTKHGEPVTQNNEPVYLRDDAFALANLMETVDGLGGTKALHRARVLRRHAEEAWRNDEETLTLTDLESAFLKDFLTHPEKYVVTQPQPMLAGGQVIQQPSQYQQTMGMTPVKELVSYLYEQLGLEEDAA